MQKMSIKMPIVTACSAKSCVYNTKSTCHAKAITIGDGTHPGCDTFINAGRHARDQQRLSGVGACKVSACLHNEDFECVADDIQVGRLSNSVQCLTFSG